MDFQEVLNFWFKESSPEDWFKKNPQFDQEIEKRFGVVHSQVAAGEKSIWRESIAGRLAEIIVLDQFSRNLFRGQAESFAYDGMALVLAQEALEKEELMELSSEQRAFLFMPFMHSESLLMHDHALTLFAEKGMEKNQDFEIKHRNIIEEFGRYPHRNTVLKRISTPEEIEFLKGPNSSF